MVNTNKQNAPQDILSAWTVLEVLSPPNPFNYPEDLANRDIQRIDSLEKDELPWERPTKTKIPAKTTNKKTLYYQVILGTIDLENAILKLRDVYADTSEKEIVVKKKVVSAVVVVDEDGCIAKDAFPPAVSVSSFAWGVPQALKKDLSALDQWITKESLIVQGLEEILRQKTKKDEKNNKIMLSRSKLDQAYDYLVTTLGLTEDISKKNQFAVKTYIQGKNPKPPEPLLLNSFFLEDLSYAREIFSQNQATKNLRKYLALDTTKDQHDLLKDNAELEKAVAPNLIPPARWPVLGQHPLILLQQAAVNLSMKDLKDNGILAVNGPPGTGKTTLLRDIVAALIAERAEIMCTYDDPQKAFDFKETLALEGGTYLKLHQLDKRLKGFEMLIASSNNKAVENVSAELPALNAIAKDATDLRYFKSLSDKLLERDSWGLISAVLGNSTNRSKFRQTFWWNKEVGLLTYLFEVSGKPQIINIYDEDNKVIGTRKPKIIEDEQPPVTHEEALQKWRKSKDEFQKTLKASKTELVKLEEIRQKMVILPQKILDRKKNWEKANLIENELIKELKARKTKVDSSKKDYQKADLVLSNHKNLKPHWFKILLGRLFNFGKANLWYKQNSIFRTNAIQTLEHLKAQKKKQEDIEEKLYKAQAHTQEKENDLQNAEKNYVLVKEKAAKLGKHLIDKEFFALSHTNKHQISPWYEEHIHKLRGELFISAMKLHKAFIDAAAEPLRHNLGAFMQVFSGNSLPDKVKHLLPDLWSSLFLVVPSISTTFASVKSMLGSLPPESLGWLLVDEAGQALPQAAIGAILRTKRAIMVGDPVQIEPVVILSKILTRAICKSFNVNANRFNAPEASVQTLADAATPYYAEFESKFGSRAVGIPLLVHRRCAEPMFSISNVIGYEQLMIQAKQEKKSAIRDCLGSSAWINVKGQTKEKWCPEEGNKVLELLHKLKSAGIKPDLYIIAPFVIVASELYLLIKKSNILQG